jgi:Leucine-rich repeat (LRR) protein
MKKVFFPAIIAISLMLSGCQQKPVDNKLDLSGQQLKKVPGYVFKLTNLEELNISNNQITGALPAEIGNLKSLKVLNANNNLMTSIPAEIGQLPNLQVFNISQNLLAGVPKEIGQAQGLQTLDLSNNQLIGLPYELGSLKNLQTLNISGNNYSSSDLDTISGGLPTSTNIIK